MKKSAIAGMILGILIGLGAAVYADIYNFNISGTIVIPSSTLLEIDGLTENYDGTYSFPTMTLSGDTYIEIFYLRNKGSSSAYVTYTAQTDDPNLDITLQSDAWTTPTLEIPRGQTEEIRIVVVDGGAAEGTHGFQITIEATG